MRERLVLLILLAVALIAFVGSVVAVRFFPDQVTKLQDQVRQILRRPDRDVAGIQRPGIGLGRYSDIPIYSTAARNFGLGIYRPEFPNDLTTLNSKVAIIHWFALWGGWKSKFNRADLDVVSARGAVPMISWEPWAGTEKDPNWSLKNAILSGRNDEYIIAWARGLADYEKPVFLRFAHEMHDQTYPWTVGVNGNTAEDYVAAWRYVYNIFRRYNASNVRWIWNPNTLGDSLPPVYGPIYSSLYPGDEYVNWTALDIYNTGPKLDWGAPYCRTFDQVLKSPYAATLAVSKKPMMLAEVGSSERCASKAEWIDQALTVDVVNTYPNVRAMVWFDIDKEENWSLRTNPAAMQLWVESAQDLFEEGVPALIDPNRAAAAVTPSGSALPVAQGSGAEGAGATSGTATAVAAAQQSSGSPAPAGSATPAPAAGSATPASAGGQATPATSGAGGSATPVRSPTPGGSPASDSPATPGSTPTPGTAPNSGGPPASGDSGGQAAQSAGQRTFIPLLVRSNKW